MSAGERTETLRLTSRGWEHEHDTEPPPVDEDAQAEARAYERGRAEERANAVALLEQEAAKFDRESRAADVDARTFSRLSAKMSVLRTMAAYVARGDRADADRLATKQGAASS